MSPPSADTWVMEGTHLAGIGLRHGGRFVDQFHPYLSVLDKARGASPQYERITGGDAVHPGPPGQALMAAAILRGLAFPALVAAALIFGCLDMLRTTATQAYVYDVVQSARAANGLALTNMGGHLLGTLAGIVAGLTLERSGAVAAFLLVALAAAVGAASLLLSAAPPVKPVARPARAGPNLARAAQGGATGYGIQKARPNPRKPGRQNRPTHPHAG